MSNSMRRKAAIRSLACFIAVLLNVFLHYLTNKLEFPICFDTLGTMIMAIMGGILPGVMTAVLSDLVCFIFDPAAIFYAFPNALIALFTAFFAARYSFKKISNVFVYVVTTGVIGGAGTMLAQWLMNRGPENRTVIALVDSLSPVLKLSFVVIFLLVQMAINTIDYAICLGLSHLVIRFVPDKIKRDVKDSMWRQKPLSPEELKEVNYWNGAGIHSIRSKITCTLVVSFVILVVITAWSGTSYYMNLMDADTLVVAENNVRIVLAIAGILILDIIYGVASINFSIIYPTSSMAHCINEFINAGDDEEKKIECVKKLRALNIQTGNEIETLYRSLCEMTMNNVEKVRDLRALSDSTAKMQDGLIITLANMADESDTDNPYGVQKTTAYVRIIAEGLLEKGYYLEKVTPRFIADVVRSAPLHDVEKKIIENAISTIGSENYLKEARNMAAYYHERWDGEGYPARLHGEVIPLSARIMAVAHAFDELTSKGRDREALTVEDAMEAIKADSGSAFDPKCVEVFADSISEVKVIYRKYSHT